MIEIMKKSSLLLLTMLLMMFLLATNINQTFAYHQHTIPDDMVLEQGVEGDEGDEMYKIFSAGAENGFTLYEGDYYTLTDWGEEDPEIFENYELYITWQGLSSPDFNTVYETNDFVSLHIFEEEGEIDTSPIAADNDIVSKAYYQITLQLYDLENDEFLTHMQPLIDTPVDLEISFSIYDGGEIIEGLWYAQDDFISDFEQQEQEEETTTIVESIFAGLVEITDSFIALMATMFNDVFGLFYDGTITLLGTLVLIPLGVGAFYGILRMIINMLNFRTKG